MEDSLQSAIDPALQEPQPESEPAPPSQEEPEPTSSHPPSDALPAGGWEEQEQPKKKKRHVYKDPEQLFRRKEANRLAAERSRIRASEKAAALSTTHDRLEQENRALKAELIALGVHDFGEPVAASADTSVEVAPGEGAVGEEENHSRNILAALMKDAGIHVEDGDEASWMQGVENFIKEAESNGRLGELAAVAADSHGDEGEDQAGPSAEHEAAASDGGAPGTATLRDAAAHHKEAGKALGYSPESATEATLSALAVALNAELERIVRDEYAATKTAILQIEDQIAALAKHGEGVLGDEVTLSVSGTSATISLEDIKESIKQTIESMEGLKEQIPDNRGLMFHAEEEKVQEENRLAAVVEQALAARGRVAENERARLEEELKMLHGYIGSLLNSIFAPDNEEDLRKAHLLDTPLSSPALAHRKRGRPRKGSTPLVYQQSALYRSTSNGSSAPRNRSSPAQSSPGTTLRNRRRKAAPGSRLRESISASALHLATEGNTQSRGEEDEVVEELEGHGEGDMMDDKIPHHDGVEHEDGGELGGDSVEGSPVSVLSRFKKGEPGSCSLCGRTETSAWRKVVVNGEPLRVCNACGLYHSKFGVLRPSDLWGDGKGIRKRRSTRGGEEGEVEESPRKKTRGKAKAEAPEEEGEDEHVDAQFEGINDLQGITVDMVAEAVATAQAESGHHTPTQAGGGLEEHAEDPSEIVVDEDLQKSFEQLTRHLEQQSRGGSGSLSADVFNV